MGAPQPPAPGLSTTSACTPECLGGILKVTVPGWPGFPWALVWALTEADPEMRMCGQVSCLGEDSQGMAWQGSGKWHREENEASTVVNTQHSVPLGTPGSQCMAHMVVPPERGVGVFTHQTPLSLPACHAPWQNCHLADGTGAGRKWK